MCKACGCGWSAVALDRALLAICFVAFASLAPQARGLFGVDGIEPASQTLKRFADFGSGPPDPWEASRTLPSLVWWAPSLGMPYETLVEAAIVLGAALSIVGMALGASTWLYLALYALYLTAYSAGGTTMSFQWDSLLLEVCVAAALHAPPLPWWAGSALGWLTCSRGGSRGCTRRREGHSLAGRWLLRFVLFKLMLMAGVVKVYADCPAWKGLSALAVHFQGQCLPHALSWWAAQAPPVLLKAGVAATLVIEGPLVPLLLAPFRPVRAVAAWSQLLLQAVILLTGSYNFFNLLTAALACAVAMQDAADEDQDRPSLARSCLGRVGRFWRAVTSSVAAWVLGVAVNAAVVAAAWPHMFQLVDAGGPGAPWWRRWDLQSHPDLPATTRAFVGFVLPRAVITVSALMVASAAWQVALELQPLLCQDDDAEDVDGSGRAKAPASPASPRASTPEPRAVPSPVTPGEDPSPGQVLKRRKNRRGGRRHKAGKQAADGPAPGTPQTRQPDLPVGPGKTDDDTKPDGAGVAQRLAFAAWTAAAAAACLALAAASGHMMGMTLIRGTGASRVAVPLVSKQAEAAARVAHTWRLSSTYGLFRRMTGVGRSVRDPDTGVDYLLGARPEVILEGTRDGGETWEHLPFVYKPGDVAVAPALALPHQPRLDWQMWFAALGTYNQSPWAIALVDKLLEGSPDVTALLNTGRWPFVPERGVCEAAADESCVALPGGGFVLRPDAVRARLVHMDFTRLDTPWVRLVEGALAPGAVLRGAAAPTAGSAVSFWRANASSSPWWAPASPPGDGQVGPARARVSGTVAGGSEFLPALVRGQAGVAAALDQVGTPRLGVPERRAALRQRTECALGGGDEAWEPAGRLALAVCRIVEAAHGWRVWRPDLALLVVVGAAVVDRALRQSADDLRTEL